MVYVSLIDGHIDKVERCVMCGKIIPEGRQVCFSCERQTSEKEIKDNGTSKIK